MTIHETIRAGRLAKGWSMEQLAQAVSEAEGAAKPLSWQTVQQWEKPGGTAPKRNRLEAVAKVLGISPAELASFSDTPVVREFTVTEGIRGTPESGTVNVAYAKGSCGGGSDATEHGDEIRDQLIKEAGWFKKYGVTEDGIFAIYADGNSMADFIVDGDIVFFRRGVTDLVSGTIYAIDTDDGLRIKRVQKRLDGTIVLSSDNENKRRFPDEEYPPHIANDLKFKGVFFYRQGG